MADDAGGTARRVPSNHAEIRSTGKRRKSAARGRRSFERKVVVRSSRNGLAATQLRHHQESTTDDEEADGHHAHRRDVRTCGWKAAERRGRCSRRNRRNRCRWCLRDHGDHGDRECVPVSPIASGRSREDARSRSGPECKGHTACEVCQLYCAAHKPGPLRLLAWFGLRLVFVGGCHVLVLGATGKCHIECAPSKGSACGSVCGDASAHLHPRCLGRWVRGCLCSNAGTEYGRGRHNETQCKLFQNRAFRWNINSNIFDFCVTI